MKLNLKPRAAPALLTLLAASCAGSIAGDVDGQSVPSFGNAAFGIVTQDGAGGVFGFALPGDSCADGADLLDLEDAASRAEGKAEIEAANEDIADLINERLPIDSWYILMFLIAEDEDDIEDDRVDLEDQDTLSLSFTVCQQDDHAEVDADGKLDNGADCYTARQGDVDVSIDEDATRFGVVGKEIELHDKDDDDVGDVDIDVQFSRCAAIDEELDDAFRDTPSAGPPANQN